MDKVEALRVATQYHDKVRFHTHFDKSEAVKELAAFGLFSVAEISYILDTTIGFVTRNRGLHGNLSQPSRVWNIHSLGALYLLALDYRRGHVNTSLLNRIAGGTNSVRAISELTDIPIERIREALLD